MKEMGLLAVEGVPEGLVIVCSFDPGETTGWAVHAVDRELLVVKGFRASLRDSGDYHIGQFKHADENTMADMMAERVRWAWRQFIEDETTDTFVVVTESFRLRMMSRDPALLSPVRITAKFEYAMKGAGLRMYEQEPVDAKRVVTDGRLRDWALYSSAAGEHARDAQRHGILWLRKYSSTPRLRVGAGYGRKAVAA